MPVHDFPLPVVLLIVFGAAKLMGEVFVKLRQPALVGEIIAGALIGPGVLGWIAPNETLTALAELGVMFLLFDVGLQIKAHEPMKVGGTAALVGTLGPRGEVGMVVAQMGLTMKVISAEVYAVVVFMAVATTLATPLLLRIAFRNATPVPVRT